MASGPDTTSSATPDTPSPTPDSPPTPRAPATPPNAPASANPTPRGNGGSGSNLSSEFSREARAAWERTKNSTGGWLLADKKPTEEVSLIKTPFYIISDWVKASVGNVFRRGKEVIIPAGNSLKAAWQVISKPITSPIQTIFHPIKYAANFPRIFTAAGTSMINYIKAPLTFLNEGYQDGIQSPIERIDYKVAKVPPKKITARIAEINNKVANVMGWPMRKADDMAKWVASKAEYADGYVGAIAQA
ncbi:MAG: hypothetical protein PHP74_04290 [Candidatus Gracilibacteria bacterium]|nr:hypothetical protein [Candidatus Gracilibacteria bacterium]